TGQTPAVTIPDRLAQKTVLALGVMRAGRVPTPTCARVEFALQIVHQGGVGLGHNSPVTVVLSLPLRVVPHSRAPFAASRLAQLDGEETAGKHQRRRAGPKDCKFLARTVPAPLLDQAAPAAAGQPESRRANRP